MNKADNYIKEQIESILAYGYKDENPRPKYADGSPAYTYSINGNFRSYDLSKGEFPITSLRPIAWKSAIKEILWIYQDQSNDLNMLRDKYGVNYWNEWESKDIPNTIGIRYGEIVRRHKLMDNLLDGLINDPFGRRHIIDLYQYTDMGESDGLNPCAFCTIWNVRDGADGKYLDVSLIQRSGDLMAASCSGVNEVQYAALLMMVAQHCGYKAGVLYHYVANEQIYNRHFEQANEMLRRWRDKSFKEEYALHVYKPMLVLNPEKKNFYDFTIDDFSMWQYDPMKPQLKLELGI
jgi:thymidylate synthase